MCVYFFPIKIFCGKMRLTQLNLLFCFWTANYGQQQKQPQRYFNVSILKLKSPGRLNTVIKCLKLCSAPFDRIIPLSLLGKRQLCCEKTCNNAKKSAKQQHSVIAERIFKEKRKTIHNYSYSASFALHWC